MFYPGEALKKQGLALMGQAKVRNIKYGLFAELNKIQDQVVRDEAYYCSCKEALFYGKTYYPKQCIQPLGKISVSCLLGHHPSGYGSLENLFCCGAFLSSFTLRTR